MKKIINNNSKMSEFYNRFDSNAIENLITEKLKIFPPDFPILKQKVEEQKTSFIFTNFCRFYNLDPSKVRMVTYFAFSNGIQLYRFYNVEISP